MPELYPYKKLPSYPHMKPADVAIWERFIQLYPEAYDTCGYDVIVGEGRPDWQHDDPAIQKSGQMLTSRKIDVVGYKSGRVDVIEVKPHAGLGAVGQAICYMDLYYHYVNPESDPKAVIITDSYESDMKWLCSRLGVRLIVV